jgi:hypothetical protein
MDTHTWPAQRQYHLDWLRIIAFGLLVPYHVGMYYVGWGWHVESPTPHPGIAPLMMLTAPWRLCLLFLVAGAASAGLWQRGPGFVRQRSRRLLWPLLFGMFVVVPPQAYFQVVQAAAYPGSYLDFMRLYVQGHGGFCRGSECLTLPTWNHLWFLAYLWVYTLVGWALFTLWPQGPQRFARWLQRNAGRGTLLLTLALPLVAARMLVGRFPSTHDLVHDVYNHAQYLPLFLLAWLAARSSLWDLAAQHRRLALGLAAGAWVCIVWYFSAYAEHAPPEALRWAQRVVFGLMQWWCLVAACGYARHHLDRDHPWRSRLNHAVFCVYILHQTVIVLLTRVTLPLGWPIGLEAPVLIVGTFAICGLAYALIRHVPPLRLVLGISGPSSRATLPARAAARGGAMSS